MPRVEIQYYEHLISMLQIDKLSRSLPIIVAEVLDVPSARLNSSEVEVCVREHGPMDRNVKAVQITIEAKITPEREEQIEQMKDAIALKIMRLDVIPMDLLNAKEVSIWVKLPKASYVII